MNDYCLFASCLLPSTSARSAWPSSMVIGASDTVTIDDRGALGAGPGLGLEDAAIVRAATVVPPGVRTATNALVERGN